jgi:uncharacterized protein YchJ
MFFSVPYLSFSCTGTKHKARLPTGTVNFEARLMDQSHNQHEMDAFTRIIQQYCFNERMIRALRYEPGVAELQFR